MKNSTRFLCALGFLSVSGLAHAEEGGKSATLTFNFSALNYEMKNSTDKPDPGAESTSKTGSLTTSNLDLSYAEITYGNFNFYCSPFAGTKLVSASYMVVPDFVEVGVDLGLNTLNVDKPLKKTDNATTIGVFAWVYPKVGSMTSELGLSLDSIMDKGESDSTTAAGTLTTGKTDTSTVKAVVIANLVVPLAKNFSYAGGISYTNLSTTVKEPGKGKSTDGLFDVNVASFRIMVD